MRSVKFKTLTLRKENSFFDAVTRVYFRARETKQAFYIISNY